jgi:hypothetical protein
MWDIKFNPPKQNKTKTPGEPPTSLALGEILTIIKGELIVIHTLLSLSESVISKPNEI